MYGCYDFDKKSGLVKVGATRNWVGPGSTINGFTYAFITWASWENSGPTADLDTAHRVFIWDTCTVVVAGMFEKQVETVSGP